MAVSLAALKLLFGVLTCVMVAALTYGLLMDGFSSCLDPRARWMQVVFLEFFINVSLIGAWFFYKESGWIKRLLYIFTVFWFGSVAICGHIVMLLFKLTPEEASKDPVYFVLARRQKWGDIGYKRAPSVVTARVIVAALGCLMVGTLIYAYVGDGSPFHREVLTSCFVAVLIDDNIHFVVFSDMVLGVVFVCSLYILAFCLLAQKANLCQIIKVWIAYKESSWITAFFWILLLLCFGSFGVCAYVMRELFCLSPEQPIYLILFSKSSTRNMQSSDPLLIAHTSV